MKQSMEFIFVFSLISLVASDNYQYEKMQKWQNKGKPKFSFKHLLKKPYEYPQPLPSSSHRTLVKEPYSNLYQGMRTPNDRRVFRRQFNYPATAVGHQVICHEFLDCEISFISVETKECIPIILYGGAGYRYFTVVVRASPWYELQGTIRAYCRKTDEETT